MEPSPEKDDAGAGARFTPTLRRRDPGSGIIFSGLEGQWNQAPRDKRWDEDPFLGQPYGIGGQQASQDFVKNSRTKSWQRRFLLGLVVGSLFAVEAYILYLLLRSQSVVIDGEERPQTFQQRLSTPTVLWSGALMAYITAAVLSGIPVLLACITKPDFSRVEDPEFLLLDKQHMRMDLLSRARQSGLPPSGTLESKIVIHIDKCAKVRVDIEFEVAVWEHRAKRYKIASTYIRCWQLTATVFLPVLSQIITADFPLSKALLTTVSVHIALLTAWDRGAEQIHGARVNERLKVFTIAGNSVRSAWRRLLNDPVSLRTSQSLEKNDEDAEDDEEENDPENLESKFVRDLSEEYRLFNGIIEDIKVKTMHEMLQDAAMDG